MTFCGLHRWITATAIICVVLVSGHALLVPGQARAHTHTHRHDARKGVTKHLATSGEKTRASEHLDAKVHPHTHKHTKKICALYDFDFVCPNREHNTPDTSPVIIEGNAGDRDHYVDTRAQTIPRFAALPPPRLPLDDKVRLLI